MYDYPPYTGECIICNKQIKHERSWIKHLKSKRHKHKEIMRISDENTMRTHENTNENTMRTQMRTHENTKCYNCDQCDKKFTTRTSRDRHKRKYCRHNNNININNQTINNTTNNTNITNNIDNSKNININIYGNEDLKNVLNIESYFEMINLTGTELLENFLKLVYIKQLENRNIKYTNLRSNDCKVLVAPDKWEVRNIDEVLDDRIKSSSGRMKQMLKHFLVTSIPDDGEYLQKQLKQSEDASKDLNNISKINNQNDKEIQDKNIQEEIENFYKVKKNHKREIYNVS
jgi:hypothetical protein